MRGLVLALGRMLDYALARNKILYYWHSQDIAYWTTQEEFDLEKAITDFSERRSRNDESLLGDYSYWVGMSSLWILFICVIYISALMDSPLKPIGASPVLGMLLFVLFTWTDRRTLLAPDKRTKAQFSAAGAALLAITGAWIVHDFVIWSWGTEQQALAISISASIFLTLGPAWYLLAVQSSS